VLGEKLEVNTLAPFERLLAHEQGIIAGQGLLPDQAIGDGFLCWGVDVLV
jgi:hypothetical protein